MSAREFTLWLPADTWTALELQGAVHGRTAEDRAREVLESWLEQPVGALSDALGDHGDYDYPMRLFDKARQPREPQA